jgi:ribonucleotide reductase beta subunit family protein with ferritin-like domain
MCNFTSEKLPINISVTPGHQMLYKWSNKKNDSWKFDKADDLKTKSPHKVIPVSGKKTIGRNKLTPHEKFLIALQADGSISERYTGERVGTIPATFAFSKNRKIVEFKRILNETKYTYKCSIVSASGNKLSKTKFVVDVPISKIIDKTFSWVNIRDVSCNWANEFISELSIWDGHIPDSNKNHGNYVYYSSTNEININIIQAICAIAGKWVTRSIQEDHRSEKFSNVHRAYIHNMSVKRLGRVEKTYIDYDGIVYCVTVPTSAIVVRRQGKVFISGNCLHSDAGCWLFRTFINEYPEIFTDELKKDIYDAARLTVDLEDAFIDKAFSFGDVEGLTSSDLKNFIRFRANTKLNDLGLNTNWKNLNKEALKRMDWFDVLSAGTNQSDFFASRVSDYSKGSISFNNIFDI